MSEDKPRDSSGESVNCDDSSREIMAKQNVTECECIGPHTEACQDARVAELQNEIDWLKREADAADERAERAEARIGYLEGELRIIRRSGMSNDHDPHAVRIAKRALEAGDD